ncbi:MAG: flavin-dependent monooxygenase [Pseudomonadales bacterium]|nr:flavin-dependent monooxygenase [Pseudomonadales bacterium]
MTDQNKEALAKELIAKAKALVPAIKERAQEAEANGAVHDETITAIVEAGLLRVLQSKDYGGYELSPEVFYTIQAIIGEGDMSAAWLYGVIGVHPWQLSLFNKEAQDEIYGENGSKADTLVASTYMPTGLGTPVEGGYQLSGQWGFSSGSKHCEWIILGGVVPKAEDAPPGPPDMRNFVIHKDDLTIVDNWDVLGLKATGSHDIVVKDAFIPEHRVFKVGVPAGGQPGNQLNTAPLFQIEFGQIFPRAVAYSAVGCLQGVVDAAKEFASAVSPNTGAARGDLPEVQTAYAKAVNEVEVQQLIMKATVAEWMEYAEKGEALPLERRSYRRYQQAQIVDKCLDAALELYKQLGGNAVRRGVISKAICDLETARCHVANMSFKQGMNYGAVANGRPQLEYFL